MLTLPKKFYLLIYVVKAVPVTDLVKRLESGRRITEKSVLEESRPSIHLD